jgi:hypothetical protein
MGRFGLDTGGLPPEFFFFFGEDIARMIPDPLTPFAELLLPGTDNLTLSQYTRYLSGFRYTKTDRKVIVGSPGVPDRPTQDGDSFVDARQRTDN